MSACPICTRQGESWAVCDPCQARVRRQLRLIPSLYERLEVDAVEATPPPSERSGQGKNPPLLVPGETLDVLNLRITTGETFRNHQLPTEFGPDGEPVDWERQPATLDGLESLEGWCRIVIEERDFTWPPPTDTVWGRLATACEFLWRHSAWILTQPWVDEFAAEVQALHRALRNAVEPDNRWRRTGIPCGVDDCASTMWVDSLDPANPALVCRETAHDPPVRWEPEAWEAMGERMAQTVRIPDIAAMLGLPQQTLRNWVDRGKVTNHGTPQQPRLRLGDVLDALHESKARTA